MKLALHFAILVSFAGCAGPAKLSPSGRITEFGLYGRSAEVLQPLPSAPSGLSRAEIGRPQLSATTTDVPLKVGAKFGYCFRLAGLTPDGPMELTQVVKHPRIQRKDGDVAEGYTAKRPVVVVNGVASGCVGYSLDHEYELVAGTWRFAVAHQGTELVSKEFHVR